MFRNRNDHLVDLIDLHKCLDPSNASDFENDTKSFDSDVNQSLTNLNTEIETFAYEMIEGMLADKKTLEFNFCANVINFDQQLFGKLLRRAIFRLYPDISFEEFLQIIDGLKNVPTSIDGYEGLHHKILLDGSKHRTEAHELNKRLQDITTMEGFEMSDEQNFRVTNMIERLAPFAVPVVKKIFYYEGLTLTKEEEELGVSSPIFSRTGNWAEHHLVMGQVVNSFKEQEQKYKTLLKK